MSENSMLYVHGIGHYHPQNVIDNAFLEQLDIETTDEWITDRVGIKTRRTVMDLDYIKSTKNLDPRMAMENSLENGRHTAKKATEMALQRANLTIADIGMVIAGGCAPEYSLPANASIMANELGIKAPCLDIRTACSTFATHLHITRQMGNNLPDYVLLIQAENWTRTIDYSDRKTAVLIGDATVATIVSTKHPSSMGVSHSLLTSDPSGWDKVQTPSHKHFYQQGPAVQKFAIKKTIETFNTLQQQTEMDLTQHYFIAHQANLLMLKSVVEKLKLDPYKHLFNVDQFGNCGSAGAPSILSQHWDEFQPGDVITVAVVGAGLTWGGVILQKSEENVD